MKRLLTLAFVTAAAAANAVIFDDFNDGEFSVGYTGTQFNSNRLVASVPGGVRTTYGTLTENPLDLGATQSIASGMYSFEAESGVRTFSGIVYGYDLSGGIRDLNLNLLGMYAFTFDFASNDGPIRFGVQVVSGSNTSDQSVTIGAVSGLQTIPFSAFSGIDFTNVDRLTFYFDPSPSGSYSLNSIGAVPEPGTMAALGLGAAALLRRRKKA